MLDVPQLTAEEIQARVLHRDGLMLVIDKPAGLPVHRGPKGGPNLEASFNALCFGLAVTELLNPTLLEPDPERAWRAAFGTLLSGFRTPAQRTRPRRQRTESRSTEREGETGTLGR